MSYFSGQGKVKVARYTNGVLGAWRWVGNVPDFKLGFEAKKFEHKEAWSGQRLKDKVITTELTSTVSATLEEWSKENVALATRGEVQTVASGTVSTPVVGPSVMAVGDEWVLPHQNLSNVVITDSTGTPVTVSASKAAVDSVYGTVKLLDATGLTLPLKATYTKGAVSVVPFFTQAAAEVAIRFEGINTADENKAVLAEVYKVSVDPAKELGFIVEQLGQFQLEGTALIDASKAEDPLFGRFGRVVYL